MRKSHQGGTGACVDPGGRWYFTSVRSAAHPPPATFEDRARGQILESSVYASAARRAGASNHRQLSKLQSNGTLAQIGNWIDCDDFRGAFAPPDSLLISSH